MKESEKCFFWNEVPYTRVEQGTYSTESETLPCCLARSYAVGMFG